MSQLLPSGLNAARRRSRKRQLSKRHGRRCAYCRRPFTDTRVATLDHIAPLSLWRTWSVTSLVLACLDCNRRKANRLPLSIALLIVAWADPTRPVIAPALLPLLASLARARQSADGSPDPGPDSAPQGSTPDLRDARRHSTRSALLCAVERTAA
ncbi:HNH endonuclease [Streptomyces sp. ODS05-4]|uniref:HNH endonuclease n=1 Tax=Streptomyces sp. ODS05-4 TaxID=2944939 RepID=UPI00210DE874|nr:HNH endonuclease [Streptomyces sp. ODS05-4]